MRLRPAWLLITLLPLKTLLAAGVHQHGDAWLDLVLAPPQLALTLTSPLANLTGFEHRPASTEEHAIWQHTLNQLRRAETLIQLPAAADCSLSRVDLHLPFNASAPDEHEHEHNAVSDELHADLTAEYQYLCAQPRALTHLSLPLRQQFPAIERLQIQLVTPSGQHRRTLTAGQDRLVLP